MPEMACEQEKQRLRSGKVGRVGEPGKNLKIGQLSSKVKEIRDSDKMTSSLIVMMLYLYSQKW